MQVGTRILAVVPAALVLGLLALESREESSNWGEVREHVRAAVAVGPDAREAYRASLLSWDADVPSAGWLAERYGGDPRLLDDVLRDEVEELAAPYNAEMVNLAELYLDGFQERVLEKFDQDRIDRFLGSSEGLARLPGQSFVGRATASEGWCVIVKLTVESDSDLLDHRERILELRRQRDREVYERLSVGLH